MHFLNQFRVREPDEIQKVGGNKLVGVLDLKGEFGARRRVREGVSDVVEGATLAQLAGRFAEGFLVHGCAERKAGSSGNLSLGETLASGDFHFDQLGVGSRDRAGVPWKIEIAERRRDSGPDRKITARAIRAGIA